jgi:hypothetical protein
MTGERHRLNGPLVIEVTVPNQESEQTCIDFCCSECWFFVVAIAALL